MGVKRFLKIDYNPFTDNLHLIENNFSYDVIEGTVIIPENQQMIVMDKIIIEGELIVEGRLILEE